MSLAAKLLSASGGVDKLYVDDVFSAFTYAGFTPTQSINNGIDLAGKGGLIWTKSRSPGITNWLIDTVRGPTKQLTSNGASQELTTSNILNFTSTGYQLLNGQGETNADGNNYISWTFRRSPKFFDVVTWTGDGLGGRQIPHSLGVAPGMVIAKATSVTEDYYVYHQNVGSSPAASAGYRLFLNAPNARGSLNNLAWGGVAPTSSVFNLGSPPHAPNVSGVTYVAYLFAHDPSADGLIQCGFYTGNGSATGPIVNLGWEPQYLMIKNASDTGNWRIIDSMRGMPVDSADATLQANSSAAESSVDYISPTATGFQVTSTSGEVNTSGSTYIYLAIRRPNKPPTTGTQVYQAVAYAGNGVANRAIVGAGFAPDLVMACNRVAEPRYFIDRLRGTKDLRCDVTSGDSAATSISLQQDGMNIATASFMNYSDGRTFVTHFFKRAPGFMDVVCYTGDGQLTKAVSHGLGVVPELVIVKCRSSGAYSWAVYYPGILNTEYLLLNTTDAKATYYQQSWNAPYTASSFGIGYNSNTNSTSATYVAYLFATLAGISKIGSYTGNGSSQTINCGFTTGSRFVMIKRTDAAGDWYVWDTVRGLVAGNDPHLSLNTTAAEVTSNDSLDPASVGFVVNQLAATNINVTSASYIYLSFA